jgi:hypothetical protein
MSITKHLLTIVIMLATVITITFPVSTPAQGTSLESYRNADLGYAIDYPSDWEASDSFGILEIDSPKESLVATLQVISLADDTSLGEFSNGRVQNVEAVTRNVDMAVYEDTEFGGNDAQGIKYKINGNTVYTIWTIEDDKAYVLTISIKNSDMESSLLNQANQIKDSFRLLNTDRITSVNSESSDDDDDDDNNDNDNVNGRDIVIEEETLFEIDNIIKNPVTSTDTDSNTDTNTDSNTDPDTDSDTDPDTDSGIDTGTNTDSDIITSDIIDSDIVTSDIDTDSDTDKDTDTDSDTDKDTDTDSDTDKDTDTDSDTDKNVDCDGRQDFVNALGVCKDTEQVDDYDTEETADNELISREIPMINSANGIELDEEETETEESPDNGNNNNDNGKHNGNGKNNGNDGAD